MFDSIFAILALLFIKHWYVDFVDQSDEEVKHKGIYFDWLGVKHSIKQGAGTMLVLVLCGLNLPIAFTLGAVDFIFHYHIDYCKMRFGNRDVNTKEFWAQLGLDQLGHSLTYLLIVWILV